MEWYEVAFDRLYPVLYPHRDAAEAEIAMETYGPLFDGRAPVLDLATGGGRYLEVLRRRGVDVYGLDLSHHLLRLASTRPGGAGRLVQADMRHLPFRDRTFGGVLNMFTSFGYFSADTDNLLVFREVSRVMTPDGVFLFDFINAEHIAETLLAESERETDAYTIREKRQIQQRGKYLVKQAVLVHRETGQREEIEERLRLYTRDDLVTMLKSVGLVPRDVYGDYHRNPFASGVSERVIIVSDKVRS